MAGVLCKTPPHFADPFLIDLEAFIATFCGTEDLFSIPCVSCTPSQTTNLFPGPKAVTANAFTATVVQPNTAAPQETNVRADNRSRLAWADAVAIFKMKRHKTSKTAARVAATYKITPKAVRDVWNRKTWIVATKHLWTCKQVEPADAAHRSLG